MSPAQTQLYFRSWQAAAKAHGWNTAAGIAAALAAHHAGQVWTSPALNQVLSQIYQAAESLAQREHHSVSADALRHSCTIVATGRHVSCKKFSNSQFDRVLALLRLLANPESLKNLSAWQDGDAGERRRHVHVITSADAPYWRKIAQDKFGHTDLDRLSLAELRQLSMTIRNRRPRTAAQPDFASA